MAAVPAMDAGEISGPAIARLLASCNTSARGRAVRLFISWIPTACPPPSDAELLKIWKGLFYALWHADKPPAQLSLASRLASLIESLPVDLSSRYLSALLVTLRREWPGIDFLRLDKFYALLRRALRSAFALLRSRLWDLDLTINLVTILSEKSLLSSDKHQAQGVNYHLAEIFLDELKEFLPLPLQALDELLKPFFLILEKSPDKVLVNKVKTNVFNPLLENGGQFLELAKKEESVETGSNVEKFGKIAFLLGFSQKIFKSASRPETLQGNRKVLFGLHDGFVKLEKHLEESRVTISAENFDNWNEGKAVQPREIEVEVGGENKPLKKRKKLKEVLVSEGNEITEVAMGNDTGDVESLKPRKKKKKKKDKSGKVSDGVEKKKKKVTNNRLSVSPTENVVFEPNSENDAAADGMNGNGDAGESFNFDESVISNLQRQFEKVAAEVGLVNGNTSSADAVETLEVNTVPKKRKRGKNVDIQAAGSSIDANGGNTVGKSGEKSAKKVRFSMKSNLVWKPHSPLPPQSLRLPPSATPRGSALKKGVPPGPIREFSSAAKKVKVKKARKGAKSVSPAIKRLWKLQNLSI
ncbi:putative nucleolar, Nop52 [Dioscorea sansibarensis]